MLTKFGTGIAIIAGGTGTVAARGGGKRDGASAEKGIVESAEELGFTTLLTAVENADPVVADTLTNDEQYTVFAPTDDAFADFFETVEGATGLTAADLLDDPDDLLTNTLLFHVTEGRRYARSIVNAPEIETLLEKSVSVEGTTLDDRATITETNVEASNGVIHAIDTVLTTPTVDQILAG
jgi:uncharacterized surface protein with fasciclin (FAS1) repeats